MSQEGLIEKKEVLPSSKTPLNEEEIKLAGLLIEEAHELMGTPLGYVFPLLGPCSSSGKKVSGEGLIDHDGDDSDEEGHKGMNKE
jgi:hypothetical protein